MKKILIVDDSSAVRKAIHRILEPLGYRLDEAKDGKEALEICVEEEMPDGVLLDIDMPRMDGISFLEELREASGSQPTVVMCTTHGSLSKIGEALDAGADEYVMKPFDAEIIEGKLDEVGLL